MNDALTSKIQELFQPAYDEVVRQVGPPQTLIQRVRMTVTISNVLVQSLLKNHRRRATILGTQDGANEIIEWFWMFFPWVASLCEVNDDHAKALYDGAGTAVRFCPEMDHAVLVELLIPSTLQTDYTAGLFESAPVSALNLGQHFIDQQARSLVGLGA